MSSPRARAHATFCFLFRVAAACPSCLVSCVALCGERWAERFCRSASCALKRAMHTAPAPQSLVRAAGGRGEMAPSGDQGVRGARNTTVAATEVRQRRRDGVEKRSRRGGRNKRDGSGDRVAAAEERWHRAAIKARGRNNSDYAATAAAKKVRQPRKDGAERRSRRGGANKTTAAATEVRRLRRDGADRRSRHQETANYNMSRWSSMPSLNAAG